MSARRRRDARAALTSDAVLWIRFECTNGEAAAAGNVHRAAVLPIASSVV